MGEVGYCEDMAVFHYLGMLFYINLAIPPDNHDN